MVIVWLLRGLAFSVPFIRHHVYLFLLFSLELRQSTDELSTSILRIRANSSNTQKRRIQQRCDTLAGVWMDSHLTLREHYNS